MTPDRAPTATPVGPQSAWSIEQGYFVLTMMPSLFCPRDCPHCYLSKAERHSRKRLPNPDLATIMHRIADYYAERGIARKTIQAYQYGGEPTSMGLAAFREMLDTMDGILTRDKGYDVHHTILTSLLDLDLDAWLPLIEDRCGGRLQSSYDGRMRGGAYLRTWDEKMRAARDRGLRLSTISVINSRILEDGPAVTLEYLSRLGVAEASFLPFMWNEQNNGRKYDLLAPRMDRWSEFMIRLTELWIEKSERGDHVPEIGQMRFILEQANTASPVSNIAGQTLFLLPDGDFALPDYRNGWQEYMNRFGNGVETGFAEILNSPKRRAYMRRQMLRNGNTECLSCPHADKCVMEFWKDNRPGDDCFGGRRYVEWLLLNRERILAPTRGKRSTMSLF